MHSSSASETMDQNHLYLYKSAEGCRAITEWYDGLIEQISVPIESRYIQTRFGATHMLTCGKGGAPPLFLVQGIGCSSPLWRNQLPELAEHFRVHALDTPGQPGRSAPNPLSFFNDDYVQWLIEVLNVLNIDRADFIGISSGAWQIMQMSVHSPHRINKMVLLSPIGLSRARLPWKIWFNRIMKKSMTTDVLENELTTKSINKARIRETGSFGVFDRQVARSIALCTRHFRMDRALKIYNKKTGRISYRRAFRILKRFLLSEPKSIIRRIKPDCLILFGENEILFDPQKVADRINKLVPKAEVRIIEGAGHGCIYDQPDESNRRIIEFLLKDQHST